MKNQLTLIFLLILFSACSSDADSTVDQIGFCNRDRELVTEINPQEGELIFLDAKDRYAIRYYPILPTIDEVTYYVLCQQPAEFEVDDQVTFSGEVYAFDENEGFKPQVGGTTFYYLEVESLAQIE